MEQCSEADMALDQRDLKYVITNAMKQNRPGRLYKYIITSAMKQTRPGRLTENSQVHWDEYLNSV